MLAGLRSADNCRVEGRGGIPRCAPARPLQSDRYHHIPTGSSDTVTKPLNLGSFSFWGKGGANTQYKYLSIIFVLSAKVNHKHQSQMFKWGQAPERESKIRSHLIFHSPRYLQIQEGGNDISVGQWMNECPVTWNSAGLCRKQNNK